ncbi:MAG: DUF4342 domain-containing protein [Actinobacteria bacterium]|nr:DUF4342 domain-containing protein [Actinomycetota bacterium]
MTEQGAWEEIKVAGDQILQKVRELVHEGNVRRIIISDEEDKTLMELPLTVGVIGVLVAPLAAAVGALAALVTHATIRIERVDGGNATP